MDFFGREMGKLIIRLLFYPMFDAVAFTNKEFFFIHVVGYNIVAICFSTADLIKAFIDIPACWARMAILLCVSEEIRMFREPE